MAWVLMFPQVGTFVSRVDPDRVQRFPELSATTDGAAPVRRNVVVRG